jgi:hypothetical protein
VDLKRDVSGSAADGPGAKRLSLQKESVQKESVAQVCAAALPNAFDKWNGARRPKLEMFEPVHNAVLGPLLKQDAGIPSVPGTNHPSMLLHGLGDEAHKTTEAYKHIATAKDADITALYATSGAGKTRSLLEYLSHNFGVYLVVDTDRNPGSQDMCALLSSLHDRLLKVRHSQDSKEASIDNLCTVKNCLATLLYIRQCVFDYVNDKLVASTGGGDGLTPLEWLLLQLYPEDFLGEDVFLFMLKSCLKRANLTSISDDIYDETNRTSRGAVCVDEAQLLLHMLPGFFVSSTRFQHGVTKRSAYWAVAKGLRVLARKREAPFPVLCGTSLSFDALRTETWGGTMAKERTGVPVKATCHRLPRFDVAEVKAYLCQILDLADMDDGDEEGKAKVVLEHVARWLVGRPRWTATFLSIYLTCTSEPTLRTTSGQFNDKEARLLEALDRYVCALTKGPRKPGEELRRDSQMLAGGASAFSAVARYCRRVEGKKAALTTSGRAIDGSGTTFQHQIRDLVLGGVPTVIHEDAEQLIEFGLAAVNSVFRNGAVSGIVNEPLVVEAARNYYLVTVKLVQALMTEAVNDASSASVYLNLFELLSLAAIQAKFDTIGRGQVGDVLGVETWRVPSKSAYGVLALKCDTMEETVAWLESAVQSRLDGMVAPFCLPDNMFGPDMVFLRWNDEHDSFRPVFAQKDKFKNVSQMPHHETEVQQGAMLTITPSLLYHTNRDAANPQACVTVACQDRWTAVRQTLLYVGDGAQRRPTTRLMIQVTTEATATTASGLVHLDDGPATDKRCTSPTCTRDHDTVVSIDKVNASTFFGTDVAELLDKLQATGESIAVE